MKNYDLSLSTWGPYNKNYLGASHVADKEKGLRFDLNLFPGFYRRNVILTKDIADNGAKMLAASTDLSHYVYRYQMQGQDKIYIDADFRSENGTLTLTCFFVNNTDNPESLTLNALMSMHPASLYRNDIKSKFVKKADGVLWIDAIDYTDIKTRQKVAFDGLALGEMRASGFIGGGGISGKLLGKEGDSLTYKFEKREADCFYLRYRGKGGAITVKTDLGSYDLILPERQLLTNERLALDAGTVSELTLCLHNTEIDIDGILIGGDAEFYEESAAFVPVLSGNERAFTLDFAESRYEITSDAENAVIRRLQADDCGELLANSIHNHVSTALGRGRDEYVDLFIRPVFVDPKSYKKVIITVKAREDGSSACHELYAPECNSDGEKYLLSQRIMSAVTLTNVVFPVYCKRGYIRHNTPGRFWDSLYTWDSGFIGMGLLQMDTKRAVECLNTYLTDIGDIHSPYIFHGTPLPTQIFLYSELYSKTGDKELIRKFYPHIRQQYRYFADQRKKPGAPSSGIFSLWDVFYNSGGWDDYPTQKYVHAQKLESTVSPVINTAFTVLYAKILKNIVSGINDGSEEYQNDLKDYDEDIVFYSNAINKYAWDEKSGYYGYVSHDGEPHVLTVDGVNADMGMDGAYPYIAGISDEKRSKKIIENIRAGMFTEAGVSVVDTRAPYYTDDGYWNGSVWMPHQWILWKALLDKGELDFSIDIAMRALEVWQKEVSLTYNCYEHFMIKNCRGAGFHQFSGLSTPVLMWFNSLFKPFTVTVGHLGTVSDIKKEEKVFSFKVSLDGEKPIVLVCLDEEGAYFFKTKGEVKKINAGAYAIIYDEKTEDEIVVTEV